MNALNLRSNTDRFSSKIRRLTPEDLTRYRDKITIVDGVDPYTMEFEAGVLPLTVDYDGIFRHLVMKLSFISGVPNRNQKSLEAYKAFQRGFVKDVRGCKINEVYVVYGKVLHSMNMSEPPAECWIIINDSPHNDEGIGSINTAHCDCVAGAGETCSHVAATLYALSYAREICLGRRLSVTELPSYWMQPGGSSADCNLYAPVDSVCFGRKRQTECALRDVNLEKTEQEYEDLIQAIAGSGQSVVASKAFFQHIVQNDEDAERDEMRTHLITLSFFNFYDETNAAKSINELIELGNNSDWSISLADRIMAEELTRDQSADPLWFKLRYGRVTASIFARCVKTRQDIPAKSLLQQIFGENENQNMPATLHGKRNEHKGVAAAVNFFQSQNHENVIDRKCGLVLSGDYPFFAASPDHLICCDCCGTIVVEVKCPFKFDNLTEEEGINVLLSRKQPYIVMDPEGNIALNQRHQYYFQVQMQIFMSNASYGLFVFWAPKFTICLRIDKNNEFWVLHSQKAIAFFRNVLAPEILAHYYSSRF